MERGIWIGKFESTANNPTSDGTQKIKIKANAQPWTYVDVYNSFNSGWNLDSNYGIINLDSHMTRYTEWTTMSYLTNSIYGLCKSSTSCTEVGANTSSSYMSGMGDYKTNANLSTTGNITGIYDISGSAWEYVMGYLSETKGNSGFDTLPTDNKYTDIFTSSNTSTDRYSVITHINGITSMNGVFDELLSDKTKKTSWYYDPAYSVYATYPWFRLGSHHGGGVGAGAFGSYYGVGGADSYGGFRVALS